MAIVKPTEYPGIAFNYDPASQPFFEAIARENLSKLKALPHGQALLGAIANATPTYTGPPEFEGGAIKVMIQPPIEKQFLTPGLSKTRGVTDQAKYDAFQQGTGKMIPTMPSKTQAHEVSSAGAKGGGGTPCFLFYSNTEIISGTGEWLPPHITMGHELIHCQHALYGQTKTDNQEEEWETVGIKGFGGTYTENQLRSDAGMPLRTKYFSTD